MRKKIRTALLVALLSILFCVGVSAADYYTTRTGSQGLEATVSSKADLTQVDGTVIELLPNATFRVELQNGQQVRAFISGKLRMNFIRIHSGDKVIVEMDPSDQSKGRIIWRYK